MRHEGRVAAAAWVLLVVVSAGCKGSSGKDPDATPVPRASRTHPAQDADGGSAGDVPKRVYWNQVAGRFYPGDPEELDRAVAGYLKDAAPPPSVVTGRELLGFTSPHAGYPYSGPVAGHGYRLLEGREVSTVVVLGFSHQGSGNLSAVLDMDSYRTPLGAILIDTKMVRALIEKGEGVIEANQAPFAGEHSLETQLPFIARAVPHARIVPIMVGRGSMATDHGLVDLLHDAIGMRADVVVVASTDLSHYRPYDEASSTDKETLGMIASGQWDEIASKGPQAGLMCGYYTVGVLMGLAARQGPGKATGTVVKYLNSGDTAGDRSAGVVGYGVVAFTVPAGTRSAVADAATGEAMVAVAPSMDGSVLDDDARVLLGIAMDAAIAAVQAEPFSPSTPASNALTLPSGTFVLVRVRDRIQGIGGGIEATEPLFEAVAAAATEAVVADPRFPAPRPDEIPFVSVSVIVVRSVWPLDTGFAVSQFIESTQEDRGVLVQAAGQAWVVHAAEGEGHPLSGEDILSKACRRVSFSPACFKDGVKNEVEPVFTAFTGDMFSGSGAQIEAK